MYKNILFDLDGTIIESSKGIMNAAKYTLNKMEKEIPDESILKKFIGPPLQNSFAEYIGLEGEEIEKAICYFREYYIKTGVNECELYEGITDVLEALKQSGKKIMLATSKPLIPTRKILEDKKITHFFDYISGSDAKGLLKTKEDVIENIIKTQNISINESVMIGDRVHDIIGAEKHNIDSIGVLYGFGNLEEFKNAKHIVKTTRELFVLLLTDQEDFALNKIKVF